LAAGRGAALVAGFESRRDVRDVGAVPDSVGGRSTGDRTAPTSGNAPRYTESKAMMATMRNATRRVGTPPLVVVLEASAFDITQSNLRVIATVNCCINTQWES
jgi:hypothetical protein